MRELSAKERAVAAQKAREDFYFFARYMMLRRLGYTWVRGPHHQRICDALMRVFRGECLRLIINIPPRYSKTELMCLFIAWAMGHFPDSEFIYTSYSTMLATESTGKIRDIMSHEAYQEIFPEARLASEGKGHWKTTRDGVVYGAGMEATITGFGAGKMRPGFGGLLAVDDPHKPDEIRSDDIRKGVISRFQSTIESRLNSPQTPIVVIMQRLHEQDLAGWLLGPAPKEGEKRGPGGNGEIWEHLCIPALQSDGTALWPEKHTAEQLIVMQKAKPYEFAGQYQQAPCAAEGNIFKPDQMPIFEAVPFGTRFCRGWDLGASDKDGDPTAGLKVGEMPDGRYIIADLVHMMGGPDEVEACVGNTADADGNAVEVSIPQDPGQAGKAQVRAYAKRLKGFKVHFSTESGDKVTRAEPFAAQVNVGNVVMLKAPWNEQVKSEMRVFPSGAHDDIEDAGSRAFNRLNSKSGRGIVLATLS